jgi:hypothetical protein
MQYTVLACRIYKVGDGQSVGPWINPACQQRDDHALKGGWSQAAFSAWCCSEAAVAVPGGLRNMPAPTN